MARTQTVSALSRLSTSQADIAVSVDPEDVYAVLRYSGAPTAEPTTGAGSASGTLLEEYEMKVRPVLPATTNSYLSTEVCLINSL